MVPYPSRTDTYYQWCNKSLVQQSNRTAAELLIPLNEYIWYLIRPGRIPTTSGVTRVWYSNLIQVNQHFNRKYKQL
jgi:hypothetical protein